MRFCFYIFVLVWLYHGEATRFLVLAERTVGCLAAMSPTHLNARYFVWIVYAIVYPKVYAITLLWSILLVYATTKHNFMRRRAISLRVSDPCYFSIAI